MNRPLDPAFDHRLAEWLEDDPSNAPSQVLDTVLAAYPSIEQRRRSRAPWRFPTMNSLSRLAGPALVAVIGIGAAYLMLRPSSGVGPPAASPTPTVAPTGPADLPLVPPTPLPDPSGAPIPANLIGGVYRVDPAEAEDGRQLVLTLRGADDPHCTAMYKGRSTCFTVLWSPYKGGDQGARGPARIIDGNLVLGFALVPFDLPCTGSMANYAIEADGARLRGIDPPTCMFSGFVRL